MTERRLVPTETQTEVLLQSRRRCCICFGLNRDFDEKKGQIAHLDRNNKNHKFDNLAFMCLEHHDVYDTQTSQSKGWTKDEVKRYRDLLYEHVKLTFLSHERLDSEGPKKQRLRIWEYRPFTIHYLNVHRLLAVYASFSDSTSVPFSSTKIASIRELPYDEYLGLIAFTNQLLKQWRPKVLNPHNIENLSMERLGCVFEFSFADFRTKNIRYWDGEAPKPKMYGDVDKDPHLYYKISDIKAYLPLNYSWITTDTAFHNFRPSSGIVRGLCGLAILKYIDDGLATFTPLVIGTYNFLAMSSVEDAVRSLDITPSWLE